MAQVKGDGKVCGDTGLPTPAVARTKAVRPGQEVGAHRQAGKATWQGLAGRGRQGGRGEAAEAAWAFALRAVGEASRGRQGFPPILRDVASAVPVKVSSRTQVLSVQTRYHSRTC